MVLGHDLDRVFQGNVQGENREGTSRLLPQLQNPRGHQYPYRLGVRGQGEASQARPDQLHNDRVQGKAQGHRGHQALPESVRARQPVQPEGKCRQGPVQRNRLNFQGEQQALRRSLLRGEALHFNAQVHDKEQLLREESHDGRGVDPTYTLRPCGPVLFGK